MQRLSLVLSAAAPAVALLGATPLGRPRRSARQDSHPLTDARGWFASVAETASYTQSWALRVCAVCAALG